MGPLSFHARMSVAAALPATERELASGQFCCATTRRRVKAGGVPVSVRSRGRARRAGRRPCTGGVLVRAWWVAWDFPGRGPAARIPALPGPGLSPGGAVEDGRAARSPPPASTAPKPNPGGGRGRALPSRSHADIPHGGRNSQAWLPLNEKGCPRLAFACSGRPAGDRAISADAACSPVPGRARAAAVALQPVRATLEEPILGFLAMLGKQGFICHKIFT